MKKKIALLMSAVMLFGVVVGGTIAWLTDETPVVTNTFTNTAKIDITLDEAKVVNGQATSERTNANTYDMIPGTTYVKDPTVHVQPGSVECYVYVKVIESDNVVKDANKNDVTVIDYTVNTGIAANQWTYIGKSGGDSIYAYNSKIDASKSTTAIDTSSILTTTDGKNITIDAAVTESMLLAMNPTPKLEFYAYAVQAANLADATTAWTSAYGTLEA